MRNSALLLSFILVPVALAQGWNDPRDQSWSPRGTGVPDLWVPRDLVQGETALIGVIEWPGPTATVSVLDGERSLFSKGTALGLQGSGHYGEAMWEVPLDLPPGNYTVEASGSGTGVQTTTEVHAGPKLFLGEEPREVFDVIDAEAVGFDAAPATATVVQGPIVWTVSWDDAKGRPREAGEPSDVQVAAADTPRRVIGGRDGHESVGVHAPVLGPGAVFINGTRGGAPASVSAVWDVPTPGAPALWVEPHAFVNSSLIVFGAGFADEASVAFDGAERRIETDHGFFQATFTPSREGNASLVARSGDASVERTVAVGPAPVAMAGGGDGGSLSHARIPGAPLLVALAVALAVRHIVSRQP